VVKSLSLAAATALVASSLAAATEIHVYGPGGPLPAMIEAAKAFGDETGTNVALKAGPPAAWMEEAKQDADLVFSGSENMMTDFVNALSGQIKSEDVLPLYLRPSAILVRPGNPGRIRGLSDLFQPGHRVIVVNGAGQTGLWEDMAGKLGDIASVKALRSNIKVFAANSAEARQAWLQDQTLDAWIIWNIWQVANPDLADLVAVEPAYRIYRDAGIVLTKRGKDKPEAVAFKTFLTGAKAAAIFAKWGWLTTVP
jgi:accessory colonization factor AcfC